MRRVLVGLLALSLGACASSGEGEVTAVDGGGGMGGGAGGMGGDTPDGMLPPTRNPLLPRVENTTCNLPPAPPLGDLGLEEAWPELDLDRPIWLGTAPGSPNIYVIEQGGRIVVFPPDDPGAAQTFIDLRVSRQGNEEGLLGLAFHPAYAENGRFFVYYSASGPRRSVISEFQRGADPLIADPGSERIFMEVPQPFGNHNGGDIRFGPDGYLYIALGDGGSAGDPQNHGQRPETVLGSVLRIDIDTPDAICGTRYGIPSDNPFADDRCGPDAEMRPRPEIYAWGLRNIWRMAFDPGTGELWAADVGQDAQEEIDIITRGGNYGWRAVEGDRCFERNCDPSRFIPPVHVYGRDDGASITGGFVYRGPDLPELWGAYVYADYVSGRIWALRRNGDAPPTVTLLADTSDRITSFGQDADGRLYGLTFTNRRSIFRLVRRDGGPAPEAAPESLIATGCYTADGAPAPGVIPYAPIAEFWSDGAEKRRYFALPEGTAMTWTAEDAFDFPDATVLVKEFWTDDADGAPRRFETRLMRKDGDRWSGYSYRWDREGADATLLAGKLEAEIETPDGHLRWLYPSRAQCEACHTREANFVLGLTSRQLNAPFDYGGVRFNQLAALSEAGYLEGLADAPEALPALANPADPQAAIEARARAWLDTNCAQCHLPGGRADAEIDLRAVAPFADMNLCNIMPRQPVGDGDARLVVPGNPQQSVLFERISVRGEERQMPPLGSFVVDTRGRDIVAAWIQSLAGCP